MKNDGFFVGIVNNFKGKVGSIRERISDFGELGGREKVKRVTDILLDRAMLIILSIAIIVIAFMQPRFLSVASIVNIISLTAAKLPIALGIGGAIVLTGTDISAGRIVGLTACIAASLLQMTTYANKMFPQIKTLPIFVVLIAVIIAGAVIGFVNGFFVAAEFALTT